MNILKLLSILFLFLSNAIVLQAQSTIKGRTIDNFLDILIGTKIFNADTVQIGTTDIDGHFEITLPQIPTKLMFSPFGTRLTTIYNPNHCEYLEVILLSMSTYDFKSNAKVDRHRRREFKAIPDLHRKAFSKGIFKREKACFTRKFIPIKARLDSISWQMKAESKQNKKDFEHLAIGDTIRIPYDTGYRSDGTDRTTLTSYSYLVDGHTFDCTIEGVIVEKNKKRRGYNLTYRVTSTNECSYETIISPNGKEVEIGQILSYNMKYYKVLIE